MTDELQHRTGKHIAPGKCYPLGATLSPKGVNFAVYSRNAGEVFLLLFEKPDGAATDTTAGEAVTGYTNEEVLAKDFWGLVHPDYVELIKERGRARLPTRSSRAQAASVSSGAVMWIGTEPCLYSVE